MKGRKKPVIVDAFEWRYSKGSTLPSWFQSAVNAGILRQIPNGRLVIGTLEGEMIAEIGDYIIKGVKGELYPCKPDIFAATYEVIEPCD